MTQDELVELCTTIGERDANRARITDLEAAMESAVTLIETGSPRLALVTLKAALLPE